MSRENTRQSFDRIIVSVHVPKTAGTSLLHLLRRAVGEDAVLADYADDPSNPTSPRNLDPERYFSHPATLPTGIRAVHGHFHIGKYPVGSNAFRMTFLRDPVDTMISIYSYWRKTKSGNPLHDYFLKARLDVFELAQLPLLRNMLSRNYFGGADMRQFDFIGRYETFAEDVTSLSGRLGVSLKADVHLNQVDKDEHLSKSLKDSPQTYARLRAILIDDVRFYEKALSIGHK